MHRKTEKMPSFPLELTQPVTARLLATLASGENPHQAGALYTLDPNDPLGPGKFINEYEARGRREGYEIREPSFNNLYDRAMGVESLVHMAANLFKAPDAGPKFAVVIKHGKACGASYAWSARDATLAAITGDRLSAFGGMVVTNFEIDAAVAEAMLFGEAGNEKRLTLDGVTAPRFTREAAEILERKNGGCRLFSNPYLEQISRADLVSTLDLVQVRSQLLVQTADRFFLDLEHEQGVWYGPMPDDLKKADLLLAEAVVRRTGSNSISIVCDGKLIGNCGGQQNRVECAKIAVEKARRNGHSLTGAAAASDAFFPFKDGVDVLIEAGIGTIFAPSGSVRDDETIRACEDAWVSLYMIPTPYCRGFLHK